MVASTRVGKLGRADWGLLFIVLALLVVGLVMVYSASYGFALSEGGPFEDRPTYFVRRQVIFALLGIAALFILSRIDYHYYVKYALWILGATVVVLLPMLLVRRGPENVSRWLFGSSVQPAELARLGATVYIAIWLAAKGENIRKLNLGLVPFAVLLGLIAGLIILQPNFSTAVLLIATATTMFFAAGADMKQLLIAFLFGGLALALVAFAAPYRSERVSVWLNSPFADASGRGFQIVQSLIALNRGGWFGIGLGQSQQKFSIFAPHTDSLFAIIGEELGFFGTILVIALYVLWTWRGLRVALRASDTCGMLLGVGLVSWVTFQAALHIAVATASTPPTGTVMPFLSYGGSSLMSCLASVGILLNISRHGPTSREERA